MTPSQAAKHRWKQDRARQKVDVFDHERSGDPIFGDIVVRTTVRQAAIIKRLSADAEKGDTRAARELRAWLAELQVERDTDVSDLDERTRQRLLARLLAEIEHEDRDQLA